MNESVFFAIKTILKILCAYVRSTKTSELYISQLITEINRICLSLLNSYNAVIIKDCLNFQKAMYVRNSHFNFDFQCFICCPCCHLMFTNIKYAFYVTCNLFCHFHLHAIALYFLIHDKLYMFKSKWILYIYYIVLLHNYNKHCRKRLKVFIVMRLLLSGGSKVIKQDIFQH